MNASWKHPFSCLVSGPSGSGKTHFVSKLLRCANEKITPPPQRIIFSYRHWQPEYDALQRAGVEFEEGVLEPTSHNGEIPVLFIIDDQMSEIDGRVTHLFVRGSHHLNISIIYIVQNLFGNNKEHRTISLNSHYFILFKNPRDRSQIKFLASQMYPDNPRVLTEAFQDATRLPHSYLMIDLKQETAEELRLRTNVLSDEIIVYVPK